MIIALQFLACVFVADFLSGLVHWMEDAYGREDFPVTGRLVTKPNVLHHHHPRHFTKNSWLYSSWILICLAVLLLFVAWALDSLTWHVWVVAILGANANQIHKWAHRTPEENGWLITFLQRCRILQSPRHHAFHHTNPKDSHYCVLTDFLNPLLDRVDFWTRIERLILKVFRLSRRVDSSVEISGELRQTPNSERSASQRPTPDAG